MEEREEKWEKRGDGKEKHIVGIHKSIETCSWYVDKLLHIKLRLRRKK